MLARLRPVIRRVLLVVLMLMLPLQWSWSVAAGICDHEVDGAHFGHHEHKKCAADLAPDPVMADDETPDQQHPDCQECHGAGVACLSTLSKPDTSLPRASFESTYRYAVPEPPLERLLRPPLPLVA